MNQKGFAPIIVILIILAAGLVGGFIFVNHKTNLPAPSSISSPTPIAQSPSPTSTATQLPLTRTGSQGLKSPSPVALNVPKPPTCNGQKDVCFSQENPTVTIQEGYLEDSSYWISRQLLLIGIGSGGYEVIINGFPKEFSVRVPDQNFSNGSTENIYLRAQKGVAKKGTYNGTISVRSFITNKTTTTNLTLNYSDWDTSAIHTDPASISLDCTIRYNVNYANSRQFDCGKFEDDYLSFYYFKNSKTIEVRTKPENSEQRSVILSGDYTHSNTINPGQDVYILHYDPAGFNYQDLTSEPAGVYKGNISFVNQADQQEIIHIPYTITVHAYNPSNN